MRDLYFKTVIRCLALSVITMASFPTLAADFPIPAGLSPDQINAAREILQGKSIADLKRLSTRKVSSQNLAPQNQPKEDGAAKRRKLQESLKSGEQSQLPPKVKGKESLIVMFESQKPNETSSNKRDSEFLAETSKGTILESKRVPARGIYMLDEEGILRIPNVPPINLKGLTEDQILDRLSVEPLFAGVEIVVKLMTIQPVDVAGLKPFGYDLFESDLVDFTPPSEMPVPGDYIIGPGDIIRLQTYGKMNDEYELEVSRDGTLPFPSVGSVPVAGLHFKEMKTLLQRRVEKQFIGVNVNISMGPLRTIRVFVLGEVKYPGSYTLDGLASMTQALYASGGVKNIGSLRNIQLKRNGNVVGTLDIYDLLLKGDTSKDLRLQAGDAVFVPPVGSTVSLLGEIRRPAIYEVISDIDINSVIELAGGFAPSADRRQVQIERANSQRVKNTIDLDLSTTPKPTLAVRAGDIIRVYKTSSQAENAITISGAVQRPGKYAWQEGTFLSGLLTNINDLTREADPSAVFVKRINPVTQETNSVLLVDLQAAWQNPKGGADIRLQTQDEIFVVTSTRERALILEPLIERLKRESSQHKIARIVRIGGEVHAPGEYPLVDGMKVSDLIRAAGKLKESAYDHTAEITRFETIEGQRRDVAHVVVDLAAVVAGQAKTDVALQPYDYLFVKKLPLWSENQTVEVRGEVLFPGKYPIHRGERLSSVLARAGGVSKEAYLEGAIFMRDELRKREQQRFDEMASFLELQVTKMTVQQSNEPIRFSGDPMGAVQQLTHQLRSTKAAGRVVIDLPRVYSHPNDVNYDLALKDGDMIFLPPKMQEVSVMGEVFFATSHLYKEGMSIDDYIGLSGGATQLADRSRTYVVRANGEVIPAKGNLFGLWKPKISAGDTIIVPFEPDRIKVMTMVTTLTQILYQLGVATAAWKNIGLF